MNGTTELPIQGSSCFNPRYKARIAREQEEARKKEQDREARESQYLAEKKEEEERRERIAKENLQVLESIETEAETVLKEGRPFEYFLNTFRMDHEGDLTVARCMALVFASSSVANGDGLHCYLSGSSGKGKTHAAETMFKQLPSEYRYNRSFSDRYLFYAGNDPTSGLKPGVVVLVDDQTMSESVQEIFKVAVSHFKEGTDYGTVVNQKPHTLKMPPRISWCLLKVDDPGDDQVMNRLIQARIQETEEKIRDSAKKIQEKYRDLKKKNIVTDRREIRVCQSIWNRIKSDLVAVEVPCAGHVLFAEYENLRNHELFFNLVMAHAVIHRWQRREIGKTEDEISIIKATEQDYKEARDIFAALHSFGGQKHNTLKNEDVLIDALIRLNPDDNLFTLREIATETGLSHNQCYRAINGRSGGKVVAEMGGLLAKCPFIQKGGKRGQYELETETQIVQGKFQNSEITRKESRNEDIYTVDVKALTAWKNQIEPVRLVSGFKWEEVMI